MQVEISVALNFVISYLYNKLPRRRVTLFGEQLEAGLKKKFEGHWYPDKPSKGSGFRCVKGNGDEVDPVIVEAVCSSGLDMSEVKNCLPDELTLWIDPSEVSYKIGEKGQVKVLYTDRKEEDTLDNTDKEVQAASRTFNPEARSFNPEGHAFTSDVLAFTPDVQAFCSDNSLSFQPIDSLSSSLSNLSLSPSSPVPPGTWSTTTSPSTTPFNTVMPAANTTAMGPSGFLSPRPTNAAVPHFTAATFAQTKFGSTKLKTQAKRPNRLSPTEFGNFFRQHHRSYTGPPRPRSLSPRDPRVEFMMDQHQRIMFQQQQQQHQQQHQHRQMSPSVMYGPGYQQQQQEPQQLSPTGIHPDFRRQHSAGLSSSHSSPLLSPHLSPHMSPQGHGPTFHDLLQTSPSLNNLPSAASSGAAIQRPSSLSHMGLSSLHQNFPSNSSSPNAGSVSHPGSAAQMNSLSPDGHKSFVDGLNMAPVNYSNSLQHLLMAN